MRKNPRVLGYLVCLIAGWSLWAQDWPQWRGPNRDGVMRFSEPKAWPAKLISKWKVPVGDGYASPLFAGGRILQFARQGNDEVAMSVDPETGKIFWRQSYAAPYEPVQSAAAMEKVLSQRPSITTADFIRSGSPGLFRPSMPRPVKSNGERNSQKISGARGRNSAHRCRRLPATESSSL